MNEGMLKIDAVRGQGALYQITFVFSNFQLVQICLIKFED